ncbi:MAG TPA: hypothetical protein VFH95_08410 [Candidatus Kapabacteria bacterium]|nr:hypothetical protein [Candidatus Kapabacteria bacterium]
MTATFRLQSDELNENFIEKLRAMFRDREVELIVHDVESESDYPLDNPIQAQFLREALDRVERGEGLVSVSLDELRKQHS